MAWIDVGLRTCGLQQQSSPSKPRRRGLARRACSRMSRSMRCNPHRWPSGPA